MKAGASGLRNWAAALMGFELLANFVATMALAETIGTPSGLPGWMMPAMLGLLVVRLGVLIGVIMGSRIALGIGIVFAMLGVLAFLEFVSKPDTLVWSLPLFLLEAAILVLLALALRSERSRR